MNNIVIEPYNQSESNCAYVLPEESFSILHIAGDISYWNERAVFEDCIDICSHESLHEVLIELDFDGKLDSLVSKEEFNSLGISLQIIDSKILLQKVKNAISVMLQSFKRS
jgi:hypothetical protein